MRGPIAMFSTEHAMAYSSAGINKTGIASRHNLKHEEREMNAIGLSVIAIAGLLSSAALATPMSPQTIIPASPAAEQVRLICDAYGRCWRSRGPRYVQPGYGYGGRRYYGGGPGYYGGGQRYYGGGPSIGFSFGGSRW